MKKMTSESLNSKQFCHMIIFYSPIGADARAGAPNVKKGPHIPYPSLSISTQLQKVFYSNRS